MAESLLDVENLRVSFKTEEGIVHAVGGVSFSLNAGEVLAIVGESGSGKSVTVGTLMGLTRSTNTVIDGSAYLAGKDLISATESELQRLRGSEMAMIFQNPMSSLNPVHRVGTQIVEQLQAHNRGYSRKQALNRAVELMEKVGISRAQERARAYPHEFSGGMRQRVMIAMALSCSPKMVIADEPTTALDVTVQAQILDEIRRLSDETGVGVILVTHDLGVVAEIADRVAVMYGGQVVEEGTVDSVFYDPQHPYTWGLLGSVTRVDEVHGGRLPAIGGYPPSLNELPRGCHFQGRCPHRSGRCLEIPPLLEHEGSHRDRCWLDRSDKSSKRIIGEKFGLEPISD